MKQIPEKVPDNLVVAINVHLYIGWGFLYLLKFAINHLMNNAYLGLIPAVVIMIPFFWIAYDLARIYPNQSLTAMLKPIFGQWLGKLLGIIQVLFLLFFMILALRYSILMVYTYFFQRTPLFLLTGIFIATTLYLSLKGIKSIGRLAGIMLFPPLLAILILELFGFANVNWLYLRPVFNGSVGQWLFSGLDITFVLLPGTLIFYYSPFLKQVKSIKKISLTALGIVSFLFIIALIGTIGTFEPIVTKKLSWSMVEFFHVIDNPFLLLEQAGLFFLIAWVPFHFVSISQGLFIIGNECNIIFPVIQRKWFIIMVSIIVFIGVNIPLNIIQLDTILKKNHHWFALSFLSLILITWLGARFRWIINKELS